MILRGGRRACNWVSRLVSHGTSRHSEVVVIGATENISATRIMKGPQLSGYSFDALLCGTLAFIRAGLRYQISLYEGEVLIDGATGG